LADLTRDELLEFLEVVKGVEGSTRLAFGASMFNWSCYMNHSYRESPPNPHIHWWAVPRYNHAVEFGGSTFEDPHFGNPYDHNRLLEFEKDMRMAIADKIKSLMES